MISHIYNAGTRALGVSVALGFVLIVSLGGTESPHASAVLVAILFGFFVFWLVFTFLLGPVPASDQKHGEDDGSDGIPLSLGLRRRRGSEDDQNRGESDGEGGSRGGEFGDGETDGGD